MNSRQRIIAALEHREPDRLGWDLGGTHVSSIHVVAYRNLCRYLGIDPEPVVFSDVLQQVVRPCEALLDRLEVDTRGLFPLCSHNWGFDRARDEGTHYEHVDEWGFTQRMNKQDAWWWSQVGFPLDGPSADPEALAKYPWPKVDNPERLEGLRELAEGYRRAGKIVICKSVCAGLFEMGQRIRGMDNFLCDLLADTAVVEKILDNLLERKKQFWAMALEELGDVVDVVLETDDYGTQQSQLLSYETYKALVRPRLRELVQFLREQLALRKRDGRGGYVMLHSCGNIRPFLPDFIDMGVDILHPIHVRAKGMDPAALKKDFGADIAFWGGGVDTQDVLPYARPQEVRDDVKRNVEALMGGGGYVFGTVHNIQAEVPPQNIMVMWEAMRQFGHYGS